MQRAAPRVKILVTRLIQRKDMPAEIVTASNIALECLVSEYNSMQSGQILTKYTRLTTHSLIKVFHLPPCAKFTTAHHVHLNTALFAIVIEAKLEDMS